MPRPGGVVGLAPRGEASPSPLNASRGASATYSTPVNLDASKDGGRYTSELLRRTVRHIARTDYIPRATFVAAMTFFSVASVSG